MTNFSRIVMIMMLGLPALQASAELGTGDTLQFGEGSKISIEASKGFWLDVPVHSATDLVIGKAATNIGGTFLLFGQQAQHLAKQSVDVLNANANQAQLDFSAWALSWKGKIFSLASGGSNSQQPGVATVNCVASCGKGDSYTLDYSAQLPADAGALAGLAYRLHLEGRIH